MIRSVLLASLVAAVLVVSGARYPLTEADMACHDGTRFPEAWGDRRAALQALYGRVCEEAGGRCEVLSAYRTEAHNRRIGGAKRSQHVQGRALDLQPPPGVSVAALYAACLRANPDGGVGRYKTFVHCDTGKRRRW